MRAARLFLTLAAVALTASGATSLSAPIYLADNLAEPFFRTAGVSDNFWPAQRFTTTSGAYVVDSITVPLASEGGLTAGTLELYIFDAAGSTPGTPGSQLGSAVGTISFSLLTATPTNTLFGGINRTLAPSTDYFLVMKGVGLAGPDIVSSSRFGWGYTTSESGTGFPSAYTSTLSGGSTWSPLDFTDPQQMRIEAVAVPEPATWAMGLAGIACGAWQAWRRRRSRCVVARRPKFDVPFAKRLRPSRSPVTGHRLHGFFSCARWVPTLGLSKETCRLLVAAVLGFIASSPCFGELMITHATSSASWSVAGTFGVASNSASAGFDELLGYSEVQYYSPDGAGGLTGWTSPNTDHRKPVGWPVQPCMSCSSLFFDLYRRLVDGASAAMAGNVAASVTNPGYAPYWGANFSAETEEGAVFQVASAYLTGPANSGWDAEDWAYTADLAFSITVSSDVGLRRVYLTQVGAPLVGGELTIVDSGPLNGVTTYSLPYSLSAGYSKASANPGFDFEYAVYAVEAVPEPSAYAMALAGLGCISYAAMRRRNRG